MKKILLLAIILLLSACSSSVSIESFRNIIVENHEGLVENSHIKKTLFSKKYEDPIEIYDGSSLLDGDYISVKDDSNLLLNFDSDKHVYVEENSDFYVKASGEENSTVTTLEMVNGSIFVAIDNKLNNNESFNVSIGDVSLSVRGTIFSISNMFSFDNSSRAIIINTYEGAVSIDIANTDKSLLIKEGESSIMMVKEDEAVFVSKNQIDETFWKEQSNIIRLTSNNDGKDYIMPISYVQLSDNLINILQKYYNKEQLPELKRTIKIAKTDFNELLGQIISIDEVNYRVIGVDGSLCKVVCLNGVSNITLNDHHYKDSNVDSYLNDLFHSLNVDIQNAIIPQMIVEQNYDFINVKDVKQIIIHNSYGVSDEWGESTFSDDVGERNIFLLGINDITEYLGYEFSSNDIVKIYTDDDLKTNSYVWLRGHHKFSGLEFIYSPIHEGFVSLNPSYSGKSQFGNSSSFYYCFVVDLSMVDYLVR